VWGRQGAALRHLAAGAVGAMLSVSEFRFQIFGFQVSGSEFQLSSLGSMVSGFGVWVQSYGLRGQSFGLRVQSLGFRDRVWCTALEATQGQIDGFFGQLPYKHHFFEVASVRDGLLIRPQLDSRVGQHLLLLPPISLLVLLMLLLPSGSLLLPLLQSVGCRV
jgi:hypothetical protein